MKRKLLYLHGFNSSPQSLKATQLTDYMQSHACLDCIEIPHISEIPSDAQVMLEALAENILQEFELSVAGSSLGGYYATWLAEKYNCPAVLVNPSVKPYETLEAYLGENTFYFSDKSWTFDESHIQQLRAMDVPLISSPEKYLVLLQTGDETLDYHQAEEKYKEAQCIIEQGGNHAFINFENHIQQLLDFCGIECSPLS